MRDATLGYTTLASFPPPPPKGGSTTSTLYPERRQPTLTLVSQKGPVATCVGNYYGAAAAVTCAFETGIHPTLHGRCPPRGGEGIPDTTSPVHWADVAKLTSLLGKKEKRGDTWESAWHG